MNCCSRNVSRKPSTVLNRVPNFSGSVPASVKCVAADRRFLPRLSNPQAFIRYSWASKPRHMAYESTSALQRGVASALHYCRARAPRPLLSPTRTRKLFPADHPIATSSALPRHILGSRVSSLPVSMQAACHCVRAAEKLGATIIRSRGQVLGD
jgi:hypothetical protein